MTVSEWITLAAAVGGALAWFYQRGEKLMERRRRKAAETELDNIRRRGEGPRLFAERMYANLGGLEHNRRNGFDLPSSFHSKPGETTLIPPAESAAIFLKIDNQGKKVLNARVENFGNLVVDIPKNGIIPAGDNALRIVYEFDRSKIGEIDRFTLLFEAVDGQTMHHVYAVKHGVCELRRVDPP